MTEPQDVELTRITRGDGAEIRVALRSYRGHPFLDVRQYFESEGVWKPTKKGVTVSAADLPKFADAIARAQQLAPSPRGAAR